MGGHLQGLWQANYKSPRGQIPKKDTFCGDRGWTPPPDPEEDAREGF